MPSSDPNLPSDDAARKKCHLCEADSLERVCPVCIDRYLVPLARDLGTTVEALVDLVVASDRLIVDATLERVRRESADGE